MCLGAGMAADLDDVDRGLLQILQVDGRVRWRAAAAALAVSEQTVARRWARLRGSDVVRVRGQVWPEVVGEQQWLVRLRCVPAAADALARAVAARPEASWVHVASGGAEILAMVRAPARDLDESDLLGRLPREPRVVGIESQLVLHTFVGGPASPLGRDGPLPAARLAEFAVGAAAPGAPRPDLRAHALSTQDRSLLAALGRDGRAAAHDLARHTGLSLSSVRRRIHELRAGGVLYFDVDFDPTLLGLTVGVSLWATVPPAAVESVGAALAAHPEVAFAAATTGSTGLYVSLLCRDTRALYNYLTGPLAQLTDLVSVQTAPLVRTVKQSTDRPT